MPIPSIPFDTLRSSVLDLPQVSETLARLRGGTPAFLRSVAGSLLSFLAVDIAQELRRTTIIVSETREDAEKIADDCSHMTGSMHVVFFPETVHHAHSMDMSGNSLQVEALKALLTPTPVVFCTYAAAMATKLPSADLFRSMVFEVAKSSQPGFQQCIDSLIRLGFERKNFVEEPGDFSVRGGIIDVFPSIGENPLRLEFWGDTLESVREFDPLSQRSIRELSAATIIPDVFSESAALTLDTSLFSYLSTPALVVVPETAILEKSVVELSGEGAENIFTWEEINTQLSGQTLIHCLTISSHRNDEIDFGAHTQPSFNGSIHLLKEYLSRLAPEQYRVVITCETDAEAQRLDELLSEIDDGTPLPAFQYCTESLHSGFVIPDRRIAVLTEHEVFGRIRRRTSLKRRKFKGISQKEFLQLQRGDFVVHVDHGIGRFVGLQKIKIRSAEQEVARLLYADDDVLYVNLNYINRIQKYASNDGHIPALNKLGSPDWERIKLRARRKIKDIARDLIRLYARRKHEEGFAFAEDTPWQKELEASFMYEDTPDQTTATQDVKKDMEAVFPMDRLVCGDVGFGKTEVAVRAAFKTVLNGKQVGVLVPTTILAQQHFNTFTDRLQRYAVRVEALSRFRSKKEQEGILHRLEAGEIDILIGTHRLLSADVVFKDLGLLVVDEEHRFGVTAKEKLRSKRATIDTLTLTATPIPRTLHFSLMGARDLSLINTPPRNRLPVITEVARLEPPLIREAILREIARGGQVFFVHDRIENIASILEFLQRTVPKARARIAHGQMKSHELEKVMMDFLERKFDVLVATKIIESGLDLPNVNTIIINRADRFGLAELYQLRGRVGRSNVQAFAYLLTPPLTSLPRHALRRLQAIEEFTELGSGFTLSMRDLEIRGAGNLLGAEQSGYIMEMGFEMYTRILEDAVLELKKEEFEELVDKRFEGPRREETIVETDIEALIPDFYIEHDSERLDVYRRLYGAADRAAIDDIRSELRDRFGEYPEEVENLFGIIELKIMTAALGFTKLELSGSTMLLSLPPAELQSFYGTTESGDSPFQKIVALLPSLRTYKPRMLQERTQVKLQAGIAGATHKERLASARMFIMTLNNAVAGVEQAGKGQR